MRGVGVTDARPARTLSSRQLGDRFPVHQEGLQEYRGELSTVSSPSTNRPSSALKSTGHRLIHDDFVATDASPKPVTPTNRQSPSRLSGRMQVLDTGIAASRDEFSVGSPRSSNTPPRPQRHSTRFTPQDNETAKIELPTRNTSESSRPSSAARLSGRLQVHDDSVTNSAQEIPVLPQNRSRPSSPSREVKGNFQENTNDVPMKKQDMPTRSIPLSPIRQLSERIKVHDDGARSKEIPSIMTVPTVLRQQCSDRLLVHDSGNGCKRDSSPGLPIEAAPMTSEATDTRVPENLSTGIKHAIDQPDDSQTTHELVISSSSAVEHAIPMAQGPTSRFVQLHSQWTYGQRVFGRYKKTPYFYSGNIATYLGAGMFMVVFDDGTLDYRVRREDLMLREMLVQSTSSSPTKQRKKSSQHDQREKLPENSKTTDSLRLDSFNGLDAVASKSTTSSSEHARTSQLGHGQDSDDICPDPSVAPELYLLPLHHVMIDFSVAPPREMVLSFDEGGGGYESVCTSCGTISFDTETWRLNLEDETLTMKRLECGVGYEDDSTQVSDSDESSEEDMSMTPWQQMTQTFGMGKANRTQRPTGRRSSISSVSQIDRLSLTHKKIIPTPRSLKQIITDYFLRSNKKVQPSKLTEELALAEQIRLMGAKINAMRTTRCNSGSPTASLIMRGDSDSLRVVYERAPDGVRAYGTLTKPVEDEGYAVVTEDEYSISVQVVPKDKVDFLPSVYELEQQLTDLERSQRVLFAGQKVQVSLYPGSRFSGRGLITLEREYQSRFHVLLTNRIRLVNVPADKISPLREKKKAAVTITEDQFLVCNNKVKVYIGDQIYVKCTAGSGDLDSTSEEEKLGLLNGVYSNKTAAVDFADGSTGYEVPPNLIFKRKRVRVPADQDVRSLKNAVLMQASAAANGGAKDNFPVLEEGYQVKADHPRKAAVESCIVIKTHASSACDLRFSDGTIAFEVFPSQMILDSVEQQRTQTKTTSTLITNDTSSRVFAVGDYVLAWSSRFGRYCSAKITAKASQDSIHTPGSLARPSASSSSSLNVTTSSAIPASAPATLYTLAFDYGEQKAQIPPDKITHLDDTTALSHSQRLTNFSIDAMGFELSPVNFSIGEAVMARVHGTARYFNGIVEAVNDKERVCAVCFDSSERDTFVPFSAIFSVDSRLRFAGRSTSTKQAGSGGSSSSEAASRARLLARHRATEDTTTVSDVPTRPRRHSSGSVSNMIKSMDNFFRGGRSKPNLELRRASHMITEIGARVRLQQQ